MWIDTDSDADLYVYTYDSAGEEVCGGMLDYSSALPTALKTNYDNSAFNFDYESFGVVTEDLAWYMASF